MIWNQILRIKIFRKCTVDKKENWHWDPSIEKIIFFFRIPGHDWANITKWWLSLKPEIVIDLEGKWPFGGLLFCLLKFWTAVPEIINGSNLTSKSQYWFRFWNYFWTNRKLALITFGEGPYKKYNYILTTNHK